MKKFMITCPKCGTDIDAKKIINTYFDEDVLDVAEAKKYLREYNIQVEKAAAADCDESNKKRKNKLRLVKFEMD